MLSDIQYVIRPYTLKLGRNAYLCIFTKISAATYFLLVRKCFDKTILCFSWKSNSAKLVSSPLSLTPPPLPPPIPISLFLMYTSLHTLLPKMSYFSSANLIFISLSEHPWNVESINTKWYKAREPPLTIGPPVKFGITNLKKSECPQRKTASS